MLPDPRPTLPGQPSDGSLSHSIASVETNACHQHALITFLLPHVHFAPAWRFAVTFPRASTHRMSWRTAAGIRTWSPSGHAWKWRSVSITTTWTTGGGPPHLDHLAVQHHPLSAIYGELPSRRGRGQRQNGAAPTSLHPLRRTLVHKFALTGRLCSGIPGAMLVRASLHPD